MSGKVDVELNRCGAEPRGPPRRRSCMTDSTIGLPGYPLDEFGLIRRGAAKTAAFSDNELCAAVNRGRLTDSYPAYSYRTQQNSTAMRVPRRCTGSPRSR